MMLAANIHTSKQHQEEESSRLIIGMSSTGWEEQR